MLDSWRLALRQAVNIAAASTRPTSSEAAGPERSRPADWSPSSLLPYKNANELIGVAADRRRVVVWQRDEGRMRMLASAATPASGQVHLRMVARGRRFSFDVGPDGVSWKRVGGTFRTPVTETTRLALTAGGERRARVRFVSASLTE